MTELLPNIFAIEVQKESYHFRYNKTKSEIRYRDPKYPRQKIAHYVRKESIPPGSYEILFTTKGVSEEQAKQVVGQALNGFYENYLTILDLSGFEGYDTATESLQSLLKSKGLTAGNYLVIKKIS